MKNEFTQIFSESEILKWEKTKIGPPEPGGTVP